MIAVGVGGRSSFPGYLSPAISIIVICSHDSKPAPLRAVSYRHVGKCLRYSTVHNRFAHDISPTNIIWTMSIIQRGERKAVAKLSENRNAEEKFTTGATAKQGIMRKL